jgi:hypothetical protein
MPLTPSPSACWNFLINSVAWGRIGALSSALWRQPSEQYFGIAFTTIIIGRQNARVWAFGMFNNMVWTDMTRARRMISSSRCSLNWLWQVAHSTPKEYTSALQDGPVKQLNNEDLVRVACHSSPVTMRRLLLLSGYIDI